MFQIDLDGASRAVYAYLYNNPERALFWAVLLTLIVWAAVTIRYIKRENKRQKLRGSRMTAKQRRAWLKKWKADIVVDAFEEQYKKGVISETELREIYRMLSNELRLPDLKTRKLYNTAEVVRPTNAFTNYPPTDTLLKQHLTLVKAFIRKRMSWKIRNLLYRPVNIPGPLPGAGIKAARKRGVFGKVKA